MAGIGHNGGPTMEPGHLWRTHAWRQAQKQLMPNAIPMLVVKMRLKRAAELGMDYRTYASIRQVSGQDILGLLFSSNALRLFGSGAPMPDPERHALAAVQAAQRLAMVHPPAGPAAVLLANPALDAAARAPLFTDSWSAMRARLDGFIRDRRLPGGGVVVIGETALEAQWCTAARAAAYLPADRYFRRGA